jgi:hypothetical protein
MARFEQRRHEPAADVPVPRHQHKRSALPPVRVAAATGTSLLGGHGVPELVT